MAKTNHRHLPPQQQKAFGNLRLKFRTVLQELRQNQDWETDQIPLLARICAVADSFQAIIADRPYRKGRAVDEAVKEIIHCSGSQFDPEVVHAFCRLDHDKYNKQRVA